jgi:hypothetical protein
MIGEINKDFYCSAKLFKKGNCTVKSLEGSLACRIECDNRHRKHPTPKQFEKEYGHEYPDDGAVYYQFCEKHWVINRDGEKRWEEWTEWRVVSYARFKKIRSQYLQEIWDSFVVICACTPFVPDKDWRPDNV